MSHFSQKVQHLCYVYTDPETYYYTTRSLTGSHEMLNGLHETLHDLPKTLSDLHESLNGLHDTILARIDLLAFHTFWTSFYPNRFSFPSGPIGFFL